MSINRSSPPYQPQSSHFDWDEVLKPEIRLTMLEFPYSGNRKVKIHLHTKGIGVGRRRVTRLLRSMDLKTIQSRPWKGYIRKDRPVHPYRLENLLSTGPNQVWGTDIPHSPTRYGWIYLVAIMELYRRMILGWRLSGALQAEPYRQLLKDTGTQFGLSPVLNQNRGGQFTSQNWFSTAKGSGIPIRMVSKHRCYDNTHVERGRCRLKHGAIYPRGAHRFGDVSLILPAPFSNTNSIAFARLWNTKRQPSSTVLVACEIHQRQGRRCK